MLTYIGNVTVNGFPGVEKHKKPVFDEPIIPKVENVPLLSGTKNILEKQGADGVVEWIKEQKEVLVTDTTFRDAHQSLLATRIRSNDILNIAEPTAKLLPNLFSMEMWGGATFDVAYRFLNEDPWVRLENIEKKSTKYAVPNVTTGIKCSWI